MMSRIGRIGKVASAIALAIALAGCASSPWTVVRQEPTNALAGTSKFGVLPVDPASVPPTAQSDHAELSEGFSSYLQENASRAGSLVIHHGDHESVDYVIRPKVAEIDPGLATTVYNRPSKLVMEVSIEHRDGRVLDVIQIESSTDVSADAKSANERYKRDLQRITRRVVDYLSLRTQAADQTAL
jgi:hypothetical protein